MVVNAADQAAVGQPPVGQAASAGSEARVRASLDRGWRFALGHATAPDKDFGFGTDETYAKITTRTRVLRADFDEKEWRTLDLPHDWVPELPFVDGPKSSELGSHGNKPVGRAFPATSVGWYRKKFTAPAATMRATLSHRVRRRIPRLSRVVERHPPGPSRGRLRGRLGFDATDVIKTTGENMLVVRVDASQAEGWFYEGAGIYRHVWLVSAAPVHVPTWGVYVNPVVTGPTATVNVTTTVTNEGGAAANVTVESTIIGPAGEKVATLARGPVACRQVGYLRGAPGQRSDQTGAPGRWRSPRSIACRRSCVPGGVEVDRIETRFGIRTIRFDATQGFFLNGQRVQINGVCNHQDHAGVGSAVPDALLRFRMERLQEMGVNAYRTSHNPPAKELLDLADEMGMLVMDETRLFSSNELSLEHLRAMVRRDRNHPSVILWSIGNEEPEQGSSVGHLCRRHDDARGQGARRFEAGDVREQFRAAFTGINELMDVRGFNYYMGEIDKYHKEHPTQPLYGSEIASTLTTRGEYAADKGTRLHAGV